MVIVGPYLTPFVSMFFSRMNTLGCIYGSNNVALITQGSGVSINAWHHYAAVRDGNTAYLFVDGTLIASASCAGQNNFFDRLNIGNSSNTGSQTGYYDDLVITAGIAKYTKNFTAPTSAYNIAIDPYAANVVVAANFESTNGATTFTDQSPTWTGITVASTGQYQSQTKVQTATNTVTSPTKDYGEPKFTWSKTGLGRPVSRDTDKYLKSASPPPGLYYPFSVSDLSTGKYQIYSPSIPPINPALPVKLFTPLTDFSYTVQDLVKVQNFDLVSPQMYFVQGIVVKNGSPVAYAEVEIEGPNTYTYNRTTFTDATGMFVFHYLRPDVTYTLRCWPPSTINHDALIWSNVSPISYTLSVSGKFSQDMVNNLVTSTVNVDTGCGPFTVSVKSGSLPAGVTVTMGGSDGRAVLLTGSAAFGSNPYIFTLTIQGDPKSGSIDVPFVLTDPSINAFTIAKATDGSKSSFDTSVLRAFIDFENNFVAFGNTKALNDSCHKYGFNNAGTNQTIVSTNKKFGTYSANFIAGGGSYFAAGGPYYSTQGYLFFGSGPYTVEMWMYTAAYPTAGQFYWLAGIDNNSNSRGWILYVNSSGNLGLQDWSSNTTNYTALSSGTIPLNQWVHVAGVRNGTTMSVFINGTMTSATVANYTAQIPSGNGFVLGVANGDSSLTRYVGNLDQVIVLPYAKYNANFTPESTPFNPLIPY